MKLRLHPALGFRGKRNYNLPLEANASTGYSWTERERCVPSIIEAGHQYTQHHGPPGTGGKDEWVFTAIARGTEVVKLAYAPESEPGNVDKWIEIEFEVL